VAKAKTKSFKGDLKDTAKMFLTQEEPVEEIAGAEEKKPAKKPIENGRKAPQRRTRTGSAIKKEIEKAQGTLFEVPMKINYEVVEAKSRRVGLLLQPSVFDKAKAAAEAEGKSLNEFINVLLIEATRED